MSSSTSPGLTEPLPEPTWVAGPHGRLAFFACPADRPWLHVLVSHGFGEHSGWWYHVARALQAQGVSAYLFDHYHHGRSAGAAGDVPDYAHLVDGLRAVLAHGVAPRMAAAPQAPLVLLAHSNGALVTLLALDAPEMARPETAMVRGFVLCSPFLEMPPRVAWGGTLLARMLRLISPRLRVPLANRPWRLTGCRRIWPQYGRDSLRLRAITVRFFLAMRRAVAAVRGCAAPETVPLLLLSAGRERVVSPAAMNAWYERVRTPDRTRRHYPALRHELFNETDWEAVLADVLAWCRARFATDDAAGESETAADTAAAGTAARVEA